MSTSLKNWDSVVDSLSGHSGIFNALMDATSVITSEQLSFIAAVGFDKKWQQFKLMINPQMWNDLRTDNDRKFVLMHEMVHVLFSHLKFFQKKYGYDRDLLNIATDICVNHAVVRVFGMSRNSISEWQKFCWVDTIKFKDGMVPSPDHDFKWYYDNIDSRSSKNSGGTTVDDHSGFGNELSPEDAKEFEETLKRALSKVSDENMEKLKAIAKASPDGVFDSVIENRKTELANAQWNKITMRMDYATAKPKETWRIPHKMGRFNGFELPGTEEPEARILKTAFLFLDVSGSCAHLVNDFIRISKTFPRKKFKILKHTFSTEVARVIDEKFQVGGGTSFTCIADYISKLPKYPDAIFVITDGDADNFSTKYPERWQFFLDGSKNTSNIPPQSQIWDLRTLEAISKKA